MPWPARYRIIAGLICASPTEAETTTVKPIRLVCATRSPRETFLTHTALGLSLSLYRFPQAPEVLLFDNNTRGLPVVYNVAIDAAKKDPAILVFAHDDIWLNDFYWVERIREAVQHFDIAGVAGNRRRVAQQAAWAFMKANPDVDGSQPSHFHWDEPQYLSGAVGHGKMFPCEISRYGPSGVECKLLDGLLLIADSEKLAAHDLRFDERFDFHFYDLDFCRQAELRNMKMGTWPISVVHESAGAFATPRWHAGYKKYLEKYGE
ncbi:glycosyltransferase family protein [Paraburkholderia franconis]|uniref:glycosyltransferase family protein n=1 Tax=Paraburkholderia franconis TaxID=2654983 RepID=UPI001D121C48|nr:glycosyltransferase family protein [Paraburkholderia franconis]